MITTEVKGLVIRTVDIRESDRLITVFTAEMGVVNAVAKGARSLKSRYMSSTMQFCYSSFVLYRRGEHYWIKEAELIESFFGIRNTIEGLALSAYIADVLCDVTVAEAETDLLRLSLNSLYAIAEGKHSLEKIKAAFEIRASSIIGFMPDAVSCHLCGERMGNFYFDIMGGSLTCYSCNEKSVEERLEIENPHESRIICILTEGAKMALGYCVYSPIEKIFSFKISDEDMSLLARAAEEYITNQLERSFKTLQFYKEVKR
ncbi:MAG: DNA repair protein RecO [Clostridia bacterium]|nr:DNA repair protein RecO [Clostridia bacterium]